MKFLPTLIASASLCFWAPIAALAAPCTVPNAISNGQVADASKVMENFNAVADCADVVAPAGQQNSIQVNNGSGGFNGVTPLSDGQILVGEQGAPPHPASLVAGANVAISYSGSAITIAATGAGSSAIAPTIRGAATQANAGSSFAMAWPSGSVAGDLAILFVGGFWETSGVPSGWRQIDKQIGTYWNGAILAKILNGSDISAGSVTVSTTGSNSVSSIVTFQGSTTGISAMISSRNGSSATSRSLQAPPNIPGTTYLFFGSGRTNGSVAIDAGTLLQAQSSSAPASASLYYADVHPFFGHVNFTYSPANSGDYQAVVAVTGP